MRSPQAPLRARVTLPSGRYRAAGLGAPGRLGIAPEKGRVVSLDTY